MQVTWRARIGLAVSNHLHKTESLIPDKLVSGSLLAMDRRSALPTDFAGESNNQIYSTVRKGFRRFSGIGKID